MQRQKVLLEGGVAESTEQQCSQLNFLGRIFQMIDSG
jgi:hypothetical protein